MCRAATTTVESGTHVIMLKGSSEEISYETTVSEKNKTLLNVPPDIINDELCINQHRSKKDQLLKIQLSDHKSSQL